MMHLPVAEDADVFFQRLDRFRRQVDIATRSNEDQ
jgi:hypothetical protein